MDRTTYNSGVLRRDEKFYKVTIFFNFRNLKFLKITKSKIMINELSFMKLNKIYFPSFPLVRLPQSAMRR